MLIRVGIPASFRHFSRVCASIGAPALVSANALRRGAIFRAPPSDLFHGVDTALDSAGFVAMVRYGGYRWSMEAYHDLADSYPWAWWAAMDYCCEPEIACDQAEVRRRVTKTVDTYRRHLSLRDGRSLPMPVLQGWHPDDYARCIGQMDRVLPAWPALVGVGSVCRRAISGEAGLERVLTALDRQLPAHVKLHLFGVKGDAVRRLHAHPRIASVDSMAWDYAARRNVEGSCTLGVRSNWLRRWFDRQQIAQQGWQECLL